MRTILVVDDMAIFREPIEAVLRAEGFEVLTAANGAEAIAAISKQRPDLILLDLGMPVMDGLAVLKKMRESESTRRTPVIVLSAESDRARIVEAVKLGIAGYILKSQFSVKAMLERVTKALETPPSLTATATGSHRTDTSSAGAKLSPPQEQTHLPGRRPENIATTRIQSGHVVNPKGIALEHRNPKTAEVDLKSMRPIMTRSELLERIAVNDELTGFSPTVTQVLKITASPTCSMEQVAKVVGQDHAIAVKILKLANSTVYSRGGHVDTVQKAVLRIGMQSIRQAVMNIGVVEHFGSLAFERHLSTPLFWEHSIACGIIAAELAHALKHKEPDVAFTAGLLHDLGRVIYAERLGEDYVRVLDAAHEAQLPLEQVESRLLLLNHADVMHQILSAWRFPKDLVNPIVFHHAAPAEAKSLASQQTAEVLRLGLADRLAHALMLGSSGNDTIYPTEEHCRLLDIEPAAVRSIEETARQQTDDTKIALLTTSNGAAWPRPVEQYRAALSAPFRPLYVSGSPEIDAYRMFCAELAGPSDGQPPNLVVVHIAAAKEWGIIQERLTEMEREAKVHGLPLVVLSSSRQIGLDPASVAGRRLQALSTPTPVIRFIAAVNDLVSTEIDQKAA